ncbi:MAG: hypothetical protein ACHQAX_00385 [Gammaproteobacteria bacterium]
MNLLENHAQVFRRNVCCAVVLYTSIGIVGAGWGVATTRALNHHVSSLETQVQQLKKGLEEQSFITIKKEDTQTMEDVKHHLTHLFSIPLPGISFSVLSLDEEGMHVRGNARTAESLETWLGHVSEAFLVDRKTSQPKSGRGLVFEVLLHEKS